MGRPRGGSGFCFASFYFLHGWAVVLTLSSLSFPLFVTLPLLRVLWLSLWTFCFVPWIYLIIVLLIPWVLSIIINLDIAAFYFKVVVIILLLPLFHMNFAIGLPVGISNRITLHLEMNWGRRVPVTS